MNLFFYFLEAFFITLTYMTKSRNVRYIWIFFSGLCYISVGLINFNKNPEYMRFVLIGLVLSYIGDLTLSAFNAIGIIAFALAHVFYVIAYFQHVHYDGMITTILLGVGLIIFSLLVFYPFFKSKTKRGLHSLIFYYIIFLSVMVMVAYATKQKIRIAGAVLFYVSDICTGYVIWVSSRDKNWKYFRMGQLPLYYSAQMLLAESY